MQELTHFANQLKHSQLIPTDSLRQLLRDFQLQAKANGQKTADLTIDQLCDFLAERKELTAWQINKLKAGKFRGFHLGKYTLLDLLGSGGMSMVYLAENRMLSQKRAIKVLPKSRIDNTSFLARFYKEARAAAALDHPNIVKTYDIDQQDDQHYMVMEYVQGHDLAAWVKKHGPLPADLAMDFIRQAAIALAYAHRNGLIHRDVKPGNFLVTNDRQIKLMDLGLAKTNDESASLTVMHNETLMGTADYLSPEQALNSHEVDHRTDIYSLGGTLYFLIAGHPPFPDGSIAQRLVKHQSIDPPLLDSLRQDLPPLVGQLCQWLMKKQPDQRCQDCQQVADLIAAWQKNPNTVLSSVPSTPAPLSPIPTPPIPTPPSLNQASPAPTAATPVPNPGQQPIRTTANKAPIAEPPVTATPVKEVPVTRSPVPKATKPKATKPKATNPDAAQPTPAQAPPVPATATTTSEASQPSAKSPAIGLPIRQPDREQAIPIDVTGKPHDAAPTGFPVNKPQRPPVASVDDDGQVVSAADLLARRRQAQKNQAMILLGSLTLLLIVAAGFLIWAFFFFNANTPPVVN